MNDGQIEIDVCNSGSVLSNEEYAAIFEPFYRRSQAAEIPGAGLGLAVTRRLAEMMGGHVNAGARPDGNGTAISLMLPIAPTDP